MEMTVSVAVTEQGRLCREEVDCVSGSWAGSGEEPSQAAWIPSLLVRASATLCCCLVQWDTGESHPDQLNSIY